MTIFKKNDIRCPLCAAEYNAQDIRGPACPNCGTQTPVMRVIDDIYVKLNWQEMRILTIYAQRWMQTFDLNHRGNIDAAKVLDRIVQSLHKFRPDGGGDLNPMIDTPQVQEMISVRKRMKISPYFRKRPEDGLTH